MWFNSLGTDMEPKRGQAHRFKSISLLLRISSFVSQLLESASSTPQVKVWRVKTFYPHTLLMLDRHWNSQKAPYDSVPAIFNSPSKVPTKVTCSRAITCDLSVWQYALIVFLSIESNMFLWANLTQLLCIFLTNSPKCESADVGFIIRINFIHVIYSSFFMGHREIPL